MKYIFIYILFLLCTTDILSQTVSKELYNFSNLLNDNIVRLSLTFVGDIMYHGPQLEASRSNDTIYNFEDNYRFIKDELSKADLTFANLETVIYSKRKYRGYPLFNSPKEILKAIKKAGIDYLFTSNNHSYDQGWKGVLSTITEIEKSGLKYVGTNANEETIKFRIISKNGIKIALYSFTWSLNGFKMPEEKGYLVNIIDFDEIKKEYNEAKKFNPDINIIYLHFGNEYQRTISPYQETVVNKLKRIGFEIIIGSHPHVVQKIEEFKPKNKKVINGLVAYSLGNFISNQRWRFSDGGILLNFNLYKNKITDELIVENISCLPVWVYKGPINKKMNFYILNTKKDYNFLDGKDYSKLKEFYRDTFNIINPKFKY